jgi:predicted alpha-1,6-mannanase (GH76 family)
VAAAKCQLAANQPSAASAALASRINENVCVSKNKMANVGVINIGNETMKIP